MMQRGQKDNHQRDRSRSGQRHKKSRRRNERRGESAQSKSRDQRLNGQSQTAGSSRSKGNSGPSTEQTAATSANDSSLDIPGFYYDKEKKRYFKILPNQHCTQAGAVTKDAVKKKKQEETRQTDILRFKKTGNCSSKNYIGEPRKHNQSVMRTKNVFSKLDSLQKGRISTVKFTCDISRHFQSNIQPLCKSKVFDSPSGTYERLEHMHHMYASQLHKNQLICMWSLKDLLVQRLQTVSVNRIRKSENETQLDISVTGAMIPKAFSKITDICCATVNTDTPGNEYILYTTMCVIGNNPSMAFLRNLHCSGASDFRYTEFNLGSMATWCCAWNPSYLQFSIGTEKHAILLDVETRRLWQLNTNKGDVLCQAFSHDNKLLYNGTKKGDICAHDLRSISTSPTIQRHNGGGVCSLRVSADDNYIYTSDFKSKIKKWDMRQRKVLMQYSGHFNDYSVIPIHVNEAENLLYAAGQDSYSRLWDLKSGELLTSIPPPYPARIDSIPALHYSSEMTQRGVAPGLFMGIKDELHYYSL